MNEIVHPRAAADEHAARNDPDGPEVTRLTVPRELDGLVKQLGYANGELQVARENESNARRACSAAANRVNALQKAIDVVMADLKRAAPNGSDWFDARMPRSPVPR